MACGLLKIVLLVWICVSSVTPSLVKAETRQTPRLAFEGYVEGNPSTWDIFIWDRTKIIAVTQTPDNEFFPVWSNNGWLAYLSTTAPAVSGKEPVTLFVWDGNTSTRIGLVNKFSFTRPSWSPKGELAYVGLLNERSHVQVWNGKASVDVLPAATSSDEAAWSTDGRLAFTASVAGNTDVYVWDGNKAVNVSQHEAYDDSPVWGPDGNLAMTSSREGNKREIYVWNGNSLRNVSQSQEDDFPFLAWSRKGQLAWASETGVMIWDGNAVRNIVKARSITPLFEWSNDEQLFLVYNDQQGADVAAVWNGKSLNIIGAASISTPENGGTVWSTDNRLVVIQRARTQAELDAAQGSGGAPLSGVALWKNGKTIPVPNAGPDVQYAIWSPDNWLAWVFPTIDGDAVGLNNVAVWNGKTVRLIASRLYGSDHPTWEPIR
jgi:hypothetical protein